jgi:SNF2 family DNA or RNA helicase
MIHIRYNNGFASIYFYGDKFHKILNLIKGVPGREYLNRSWSFPISSIKYFLAGLSSNNINDIIIWNCEFVHKYKNWKKYIDSQILLKSDNNRLINGYNELITTNEKMFPFQTVGSEFLRMGTRALLADTVGLGKTIQAFMAAYKMMKDDDYYSTIIVVPSSLKEKWKCDILKFLDKAIVNIVDGTKEERVKQYKNINIKNSFLIVNYDLAIRDWEEYLYPLFKNNNKKIILILDEAQYIKNHSTQRHKHCYKLSTFCESVFGLSATFIENTLFDIFNVLLVVDSGILGKSVTAFENRYIVYDFMGNIKSYRNVDEITSIISPKYIRRRKEDVFKQLPERMETVYWCNLEKEQQKCYDEILENVCDKFESNKDKIKEAELLAQLIYVQQACLSTEIVGYKNIESAKLKMLFEILYQFDTKSKIVIFCRFIKMVEIIKREMLKNGYSGIKTITGEMTDKKLRHSIVTDFNKSDSKTRFLIVSDAMKVGVDLVGANTLINFDLLWNPASIEQRNGRIDRIGQVSDKINIIYFITKGTIEERMWQVLYEKSTLFSNVMDGNFVSNRVHKKELLYILKG